MFFFYFFSGKDYESHIKCITEEERYSGKGFQAKEKKGEKKQNAWVEMLQSVLDEQKNAPNNVRRIIETISKHNNTPRKKPKFINFVKNVCGHKTNPKDIDQAWDFISVKLSELSNATNQSRNQNKKDSITSNGDTDTKETNGDVEESETKETNLANGTTESETAKAEEEEKTENGEVEKVSDKKLTKKQRKEEKKRQKYEAELQSAEAPPAEEEEETQAPSKKGKKKKNRTESGNNEEEAVPAEGKNKHKKRKRQDTVNGVVEVVENGTENIENEPVNKEKTQKKKLKVDEQLDESICLHDQNVAKGEEAEEVTRSDKFNWHEAIMSALQKKGDEMPFKRLQKKVLSEYSEATGRDIDDRIADKFIKKLKSAPKVRVDKNRVYIEE